MKVTTVGLDLAKQVLSVHGVHEHRKAVLREGARLPGEARGAFAGAAGAVRLGVGGHSPSGDPPGYSAGLLPGTAVNQTALERLLYAGQITVNDLLKQSPFDELDEILMLLKRCRPVEEVRAGLMERMATAPFAEFNALKVMYFRHFDAREH